jgi:hypothetical protein
MNGKSMAFNASSKISESAILLGEQKSRKNGTGQIAKKMETEIDLQAPAAINQSPDGKKGGRSSLQLTQ